MNVSKWCREHNVNRYTYYKYKKERRLGELMNVHKKPRNMERGRILKENGISYSLYCSRKRCGWSDTEAMYTPKYQYRLPDGRLLIHAFDKKYKYTAAWKLINDEGMSVEEAYKVISEGRQRQKGVKVYKYAVDGIPLKKFCADNQLSYEAARRYINNKITFERRGKYVDSIVSALRGKKIYIGRWGRF